MVDFRETVGGNEMTQAGNIIMESVRPDRSTRFDVEEVRRDFPILRENVHGKPLVYLDNAATSQKPQLVIEALQKYYSLENANIHRGIHFLSERATQAYEDARAKVRGFLNAAESREIIFVRGTTEGINLVAQSYGRKFIGEEDEIILSAMEHHSNIVPWQILCEQVGARLRIIPMNDDGELLIDEYERLLSDRTKLVAVTHLSNALGTINPIKQIIQIAHRHGVPVLVDGAQAVPHLKVDVRDLDCDFYAFSGHKLYGPTGVGVLYGKASLLDAMPPYQGGGDMIRSVTFEKTLYNVLPYKFEAGTPNIAGGIGLGAAIDYLSQVGLDLVAAYERELLDYATDAVSTITGVRIIGTAKEKAGVLSFVLDGVHAHDIGTILDQEGIAIRTGHHCAMPVMQRFGVPATARASLAFYNTREEVDALVGAINNVKRKFSG
jgi:cysteine desulfurase/selenocysteine lyase